MARAVGKIRWFSLAVASVCVIAPAFLSMAYELGEEMKSEGFWKSDPVLLVSRHQKDGFKFTSEDREAADSRRDGAVTYFGIPVYETRLSFGEKGGVERVELTLFTRGGTEGVEELSASGGKKIRRITSVAKEMTRAEFFGVVERVQARQNAAGGRRSAQPAAQRVKNTAIRQYTQSWDGDRPTALTWNYEELGTKKNVVFRPGFIRLSVDASAGGGRTRDGAAVQKKKVKWTDNIVKESRGDVFIDNVPMVDQGQKGYCAVASVERLLRYYGIDVDEHELAVSAKTQANGTSTSDMVAAVTALGKRNQLATSVLYGDADKGSGVRIANLANEVRQYNKAAKALKKPLIAESDYVTRSGGMITYNPAAVEEKMDAEVRKELRVNRFGKQQYMKFMRNVRQCINEGRPLLWGVMLGIYPETDLPQSTGGHMRLIIGYNDKKGEILYSDSWGKGHELKRMPADWAWTISRSLLGLRPLR